MKFSTQQLASGKWGIFSDARLLATVASQETCKTILSNLSNGRKEVPTGGSSALYRRTPPRQDVAPSKRGGHRKLVRSPNSKRLKTRRLETGSGKTLKRHDGWG